MSYNSLLFSDIHWPLISPVWSLYYDITWHNPFYFVSNAASCYLYHIQWSTLYTDIDPWYMGDNDNICYTSSTSINKSDYYTEAALPWVYVMTYVLHTSTCSLSQLSSLTDLTLLCVDRLRCTPAHVWHRNTPIVTDAQSGSENKTRKLPNWAHRTNHCSLYK